MPEPVTNVKADLAFGLLAPLTMLSESWVSWTVANDFPDGTASRVCPVGFNGDGRPDLITITTEYFRGDRVAWWPNPL